MLALLLLAVALGLSNFAAAIGIGVSGVRGGLRVRIAVVFGLFEAGMPVLGLVLGHGLTADLGAAARWLGGGILIAVGAISLLMARRGATVEPISGAPERPWRTGRIAASGLALSVDNLAAGFALGAYHIGLAVAAAVFGAVSVLMSLAGLELGARIGAVAGDRSELVASALLIAVGAAIAAGVLLNTPGGAMERKTPSARRIGMMSHGELRRGPVMAAGWVLLCAAGALAAGCGSVVAPGGAASPPAGPASSASSASGGAAAGASAAGASASASSASASVAPATGAQADLVGCASVDQATSVSVTRLTRLEVPVDGGTLMATDRKPAQVRALFRDLCDAVTHPDVPPAVMRCPADFGTDYTGVFYDGNRVLARYTYDASGCRRVSVIVGSIAQSTMLAGPAASAAPHLVADFAAVMTGARPTGIPTTSNQNKGGMA